jgi:hypothetical protein
MWRYSCLKLGHIDPMEEVLLAERMRMIVHHDGALHFIAVW